MNRILFIVIALGMFAAGFAGCSRPAGDVVELKRFPLDSLDGIITLSGAEIDKETSSDGKGSLRVVAYAPAAVRLFEVSGPDVENARLTYQARLKSKDLTGKAYLEMWCVFTGKGEFFSKGLQNTITGTMDWITSETPFFLKKGERPDIVRLNLVIEGTGTVWIDDVRLLKGPLQ